MRHSFKDITIKNFRGFDLLEINGFAKINLFVGANNVGKTSILEALFYAVRPYESLHAESQCWFAPERGHL